MPAHTGSTMQGHCLFPIKHAVSLLLITMGAGILSGQDVNHTTPLIAKRDLYGDTIPKGASTCLGTQRFRVESLFSAEVAFSPVKNELVTFDDYSTLRWWDAASGKLLHAKRFDSSDLALVSFKPKNDSVVFLLQVRLDSGASNFRLRQYSLKNRKLTAQSEWLNEPHPRWGRSTTRCFSCDATLQNVMYGYGNTIRVVDSASGNLVDTLTPPTQQVIQYIAVSSDGKSIAVCTRTEVFLRYAEKWVEVQGLGRSSGIVFSPDSTQLAVALTQFSREPPICIVDVQEGKVVSRLRPPFAESFRATDIQYSDDGDYLAVANRNKGKLNALFIWDMNTQKLVKQYQATNNQFSAVAFDAKTKRVAAINQSEVSIWNLQTDQRIASDFKGHSAAAQCVQFSPSGNQVATASDDGTARIWNPETGEQLGVLQHGRWVRAIAFSPNEKWIATSAMDNTVRIWDLKTHQKVHQFTGHGTRGGTRELVFNPDSSQLVSWGDDMVLRRWDTASGKQILNVTIKPGGFDALDDEEAEYLSTDVRFSADGLKLIVMVEGSPYLFDANNGVEVDSKLGVFPMQVACFADGGAKLLVEKAFSPQTRSPGAFAMIDVKSGEEIWQYEPVLRTGTGNGPIAVSNDGQIAAVAIRGKLHQNIAFLNAQTGEQLGVIEEVQWLTPSTKPSAFAFSPDGKSFAACMSNTTTLIWKLNDSDPAMPPIRRHVQEIEQQ